jgi:hypothetical protein
MLPLDVMSYYIARFSTIESEVIDAILGYKLGLQVDTFDTTTRPGLEQLERELVKTNKISESDAKELIKSKNIY